MRVIQMLKMVSRAASEIQSNKQVLRKEIAETLAKLDALNIKKQSDIITDKVINSDEFKNSQRISIYLSTDGEVDTERIIRKIFETKKECFVPRYHGNVMEMVKLRDMADWDTLPLTKWNIKQPSVKEERENALKTGGLDLVVLPGVAFTKDGWRLGHGKGYYDTFLTSLFERQTTRPVTLALSLREQLKITIPVHEHDVKIDQIFYAD